MNNDGYDFVGKMPKLSKETRKATVSERFYKAVEKCNNVDVLKQKRDVIRHRIAEIKHDANIFARQDSLQPYKYNLISQCTF